MTTYLKQVLSLNSLKIGYVSGRHKNVLLPPLDANANKGELIAVLGRNGIGKSTLLRTLTGLQPPLGGEICLAGKNLRDFSRIDLAQKVGYISTEIVKVQNMRVYDLVALGRFPHTNWIGKIAPDDNAIIMDAIKKTSLGLLCSKFLSELSDGERQKAMIARLLAQDTDIMVMDEPTAFLDIGSKYEILQLLHLLTKKNEKTIIYSTHDLHMAISQSDKIWLILDNKLKEGAPEDLMIEGAFDHLFDSSSVIFNSENGTFSFRGEERGSFYIEGSGTIRHWTEEAVNRAGFSVSLEMTTPYIRVPSINKKCWQLISPGSKIEFYSIYEMICFLGKEDFRPI
jgi:iron complex transport system ATP-binding protein